MNGITKHHALGYPAGARSTRNTREPVIRALRTWLEAQEGDELPRMAALAKLLHPITVDSYLISAAFRTLHSRRIIDLQTATRSEHRGHYAVCVRATGKVLKTADCPFEFGEKGQVA